MAGGADLLLKGIVEFLMKGTGLRDATKGTKKLGAESKKTTKQLNLQGQAGQELGRKLQTFLGVAAIAALVKSAVTEFAKYERGLQGVKQAVDAFGASGEAAVPRVRAFLETMERGTGVLRQESLPTFLKFVGILEDVEGAMFATKLSADLTNASLGDMRTNGERLANLLQGEVQEASKSLGLVVRKTSGEMKTQSELVQELSEKWFGFSETTSDTQSGLETMSAEWNELKQSLGAGLSLVVGPLAFAFSFLVDSIRTVGLAFGVGALQIIEVVKTVGSSLFAMFNLKKLITEGPKAYWNAIDGAYRDGIRNIVTLGEGFQDELTAIWAKGGKDQVVARQEAIDSLLKTAGAKQRETEAKEQARTVEKAARAAAVALREEQRIATQRFQINKQAADAILRARISAEKQFSKSRTALEIQLLDRQRARAVEAAREIGADVSMIEGAFALEAENILNDAEKARTEAALDAARERNAALLEIEIELLESRLELLEEEDDLRLELLEDILEKRMELELAAFEGTEEEKAKIQDKWNNKIEKAEKDHADAKIKIAEMESESRREIMGVIAGTAIQTMTAVFGEHKSFAIAQALVDTYMGANMAFSTAPNAIVGAILAAMAVAFGLANVARIASSNPSGGSGFDDPIHDRMARMGGRRWASDLLQNIDLGFQEGLGGVFSTLAEQGANQVSNVTNDNSQTNHFGAVLGGRAAARQISRTLEKARFRDLRARGVS